ncbi:MAG: methyltransferase domain-containing protein [Proteobacteria bacterium]|nr:methyltransferase domain-containing protein [Pseudomonadota bacterium]MBU4381900.1 methyltransferase domain-containing protein [Pseudomonadota bacterium]MBU4603610.1 methyltransferase domain-containing protein [Pseudomonadota bacterium]MCG2765520.1 methyltransferase domain-containing protein [Desulfarculaceae bacterium]
MSRESAAPYESPELRRVTGPALRPGGLALTERAVELCGFAPGERVLDIGCGLGTSVHHLAEAHGFNALGLDLSPMMLAQARQEHPGLVLLRGEASALPLASASLHGVFLECVLSLAASPSAALAECYRVLRPGGWLVLSDLYFRAPQLVAVDSPLPGCLGGARGREGWQDMVRAAGLELTIWEDHSDYLRQLAAQLAWSQGSATALWGDCGSGDSCRDMNEKIARVRPGYFLLLARKKAERHG